ncbi:PTS sugar transporter subunit IIA [Klebsiella pneumoniae]|nr:PTS sugar transporter subunit IIA [Klebsiella pneumoniae]
MLDREKLTSTHFGESIAVPHGTIEAKDRVLKTGVVFCQYPEGWACASVKKKMKSRVWSASLLVQRAHSGRRPVWTNALDDETVIERLAKTTSVDVVLALLNK